MSKNVSYIYRIRNWQEINCTRPLELVKKSMLIFNSFYQQESNEIIWAITSFTSKLSVKNLLNCWISSNWRDKFQIKENIVTNKAFIFFNSTHIWVFIYTLILEINDNFLLGIQQPAMLGWIAVSILWWIVWSYNWSCWGQPKRRFNMSTE